MDWSAKIKALKSELRCNTTELTRKLGLEGQYVAALERGKSKNPSSDFIIVLLKFGVNPMWLFLDEGEIFLKGATFDSKVAALKLENKELKKKLEEKDISMKEAVDLLNSFLQLKGKHQKEILKKINSLI